MTTDKAEVVTSQVVQQVDTRFQRLHQGFRDRPTTRHHFLAAEKISFQGIRIAGLAVAISRFGCQLVDVGRCWR
jgi:hypothetical protein